MCPSNEDDNKRLAQSDDTGADNAEEIKNRIGEHDRKIGGLIQFGRVVLTTYEGYVGTTYPAPPTWNSDRARAEQQVLVKVGSEEEDGYTLNWMPWLTPRAGYDGEWWKPESGEFVLVAAPAGRLDMGIILGALYRSDIMGFSAVNESTGKVQNGDTYPLPVGSQAKVSSAIHRRIYKDGTLLAYDREQHALKLELRNQGTPGEAALSSLSTELAGDNRDKGKISLRLGSADHPGFQCIADTSVTAGDLTILAAAKTTLIIGSSDDKKVEVIADSDGKVTLTAQGDVAVTSQGNVTVNAAQNITLTGTKIILKGEVAVTGSLDVAAG